MFCLTVQRDVFSAFWVTLSGIKVTSKGFKRDEQVNLNNLVGKKPWISAKLQGPQKSTNVNALHASQLKHIKDVTTPYICHACIKGCLKTWQPKKGGLIVTWPCAILGLYIHHFRTERVCYCWKTTLYLYDPWTFHVL